MATGREPSSILDRLRRRGRKEEASSDAAAKQDGSDDAGNDTLVAEGSQSTGGAGSTDTSTDDSTGDPEPTSDAPPEAPSSDPEDAGVDETADGATGDDSTGTIVVDEGSENAEVGSGDDTMSSTDEASADGTSATDGSVDEQANNTQTGDGVADGGQLVDAGADGGVQGADSSVATGDGVVAGDEANHAIGDGGAPPQTEGVDPRTLREIDDPGIARLLDADDIATIGPPQESALARDARLIDDVARPQLDPAVAQARLGGRGPKPPDPDDTPDDLAFGTGALTQGAAGVHATPVHAGLSDDSQLDPPEESALADDGLDPVGATRAGDGFDPDPHMVPIDDTTEHSEPTEMPID